MQAVSLGFDNDLIYGFFEGSDSYVPVSELIYVHEHPLVNPNFLSQLEVFINQASVIAETGANATSGEDAAALVSAVEALAVTLPDVTNETAPSIMKGLREVYQVCKRITGLQLPQ